jgi:hypothetical protein
MLFGTRGDNHPRPPAEAVAKGGRVQRTRRKVHRQRALSPAMIPSTLLPPRADQLVMDPSLSRAGDGRGR